MGSLDAPAFRDYPFRYRLLPRLTEWRLSRDGTLQFHGLPQDNYTLQAAYTGVGDGPNLTFSFRIGPPPHPLSWHWLALLPLLAALFLLARRSRWFRQVTYWLPKTLFLLKRRFGHAFRRDFRDGFQVPDHTGTTLGGHYDVTQLLARSGFSVVYEARDRRSGDRVALKILLPGWRIGDGCGTSLRAKWPRSGRFSIPEWCPSWIPGWHPAASLVW